MTDDRPARIRALHRDNAPRQYLNVYGKLVIHQAEQARQTAVVQAEYERLYPNREIPLGHILSTVHIEERELRGETYDSIGQRWLDADGRKVD
jgi:hypothetical protein